MAAELSGIQSLALLLWVPPPIAWLGLAGLVLLRLLYWLFVSNLRYDYYYFDPGRAPGAFEPHAKRFLSAAGLVITISGGTIFFLARFLTDFPSKGTFRSHYSLALEAAAPWAICLLGFSVLYAVLFVVLLGVFYEEYSHSEKQNTYTRKKYGLVMALASSGVICFLVAYILIAAWVLR